MDGLIEGPVDAPSNGTCEYSEQLLIGWKMFFVGVIGLFTALLSILHNCLLYYTFVTSRVMRKRRMTYLKWISLCDIFVSLSYIAIMCVQVYVDYFQSLFLFYMWHTYLVVAFTVSHITFSSSSYLLMAATIERYLQSTGHSRYRNLRVRLPGISVEDQLLRDNTRSTALFHYLRSHRGLVVFLCFLAGTILRGTVFFEIEIQHDPQCSDFASMWATMADLTSSPLFDFIWKFWIRKLLTVILPFVVLAYFNVRIVMNVRRTERDQTVKTLILYVTVGPRGEVTRLHSRVRTVTRLLVMVVCTYLLSNLIDVLIAIWENVDPQSLVSFPEAYTVASDISSFLPIVACLLRLPIYVVNDGSLSNEVRSSLCRLVGCSWHKRDMDPFLPVEVVPTCEKESFDGRYGMGSLIMARATLQQTKDDDPSIHSAFL